MSSASDTSRRVGIDVGGTKCLGVIWSEGRIVEEIRRTTPDGAGALIDVLASIVKDFGVIDSVGIGICGLVTRSGVVRASPNLLGIADFAVGSLLSERLGYQVWVDNDATCATVAEWVAGAAAGCRDAIVVALGTGNGGGIVAGGKLIRGTNGFAGEFGHMIVDPDGPLCPCGRRGCWERYASGNGLADIAQRAARGGKQKCILELAGSLEQIRGEHVARAIAMGDAEASLIIGEFAHWIALGLANLTNALDPEMFVIGGGLAASGDMFLDAVRRSLSEILYSPTLRPHPRVVLAHFSEHAGAVGAAFLPTQTF
ncbi:MAG: ROK family protein [Actinomycetes bacterium]